MTVAETPEWLIQFVQAVDRHGRMWDVVDRFVPDDVRVAAGLHPIGAPTPPAPRPPDGDAALLEASMLLARVRDLHKPSHVMEEWNDDFPPYCIVCEDRSKHDAHTWPCPTARVVYTDDEIRKATT